MTPSSHVPKVPFRSNLGDASPTSKIMRISSQIAHLKEQLKNLPKNDPGREEIALNIKELRERRREME